MNFSPTLIRQNNVVSLNQSLGFVYDDLAYDEDPSPSLHRTD